LPCPDADSALCVLADEAGRIFHAAPALTVPYVLSCADCRALSAHCTRWAANPTVTSMLKGEVVRRLYEGLKEAPRPSAISPSAVRSSAGTSLLPNQGVPL